MNMLLSAIFKFCNTKNLLKEMPELKFDRVARKTTSKINNYFIFHGICL